MQAVHLKPAQLESNLVLFWRSHEPGEAPHQRQRVEDEFALTVPQGASEGEANAVFIEDLELLLGEWGA